MSIWNPVTGSTGSILGEVTDSLWNSLGTNVPGAPGLSAQEQEFLQRQNMTLDQMMQLLNSEKLNSTETQNLLKGLSGLYTQNYTPAGERNALAFDQQRANYVNEQMRHSNSDLVANDFGQRLRVAGLDEAAIKYLTDAYNAVPAGSRTTYTQRLETQNSLLNNFWKKAMNDRDFMEKMGVSTVVGKEATPESTTYTLNQDAVNSLKERIKAQQEKDAALQGNIDSINNAIIDRTQKALRGELPVPEAISTQREKDFQLFRDEANRRGLDIQGNDLNTATAGTTSGNQTLNDLKQRYRTLEDTYKRGEIDSSLGNLGTGLGFRSFPQAQQPASLGFLNQAQQYSPARLLGGYQNVMSGYGQMMQPYYNQRMLNYQAQIQNAANRNAFNNSLLGFGSQLGSAAIMA